MADENRELLKEVSRIIGEVPQKSEAELIRDKFKDVALRVLDSLGYSEDMVIEKLINEDTSEEFPAISDEVAASIATKIPDRMSAKRLLRTAISGEPAAAGPHGSVTVVDFPLAVGTTTTQTEINPVGQSEFVRKIDKVATLISLGKLVKEVGFFPYTDDLGKTFRALAKGETVNLPHAVYQGLDLSVKSSPDSSYQVTISQKPPQTIRG